MLRRGQATTLSTAWSPPRRGVACRYLRLIDLAPRLWSHVHQGVQRKNCARVASPCATSGRAGPADRRSAGSISRSEAMSAAVEQMVSDATALRPFRVDVAESDLADLRRRIKATRLPEKEPGEHVQLLCPQGRYHPGGGKRFSGRALLTTAELGRKGVSQARPLQQSRHGRSFCCLGAADDLYGRTARGIQSLRG
jgi:hypothetical protein